MIPFMTEDIYQNTCKDLWTKQLLESIHLCDFPEVKEEWINKDLEETWKKFWTLLFLAVHAVTQQTSERQPIGTMYVKAPKVMDKYFTDIIADELNVKK